MLRIIGFITCLLYTTLSFGQRSNHLTIGLNMPFHSTPAGWAANNIRHNYPLSFNPQLQVAYQIKNKYSISLGNINIDQFASHNISEAPYNPNSPLVSARVLNRADFLLGYNIARHIPAGKWSHRLNIWAKVGAALVYQSYAYKQSPSYHDLDRFIAFETYWRNVGSISIRPVVQLEANFHLTKWCYLSAGGNYAYVGPKMNPLIGLLGIGFKI